MLLPVLLLASLIVKVVSVLPLKRYFSWRELLAGGTLLNTHLSLEIAVAVIGLRVGLLDNVSNVTVILFAVLTVVAMPLLFGIILPYEEKKIIRYKLVAGVNDTSLKVANELRAHGDLVRFMASDSDAINMIKKAGFESFPEEDVQVIFSQLDVEYVEAFLALHDNGAKNLELSRLARQTGIHNIVAYVVDPVLLPEFKSLKVQAYTPAVQRATLISMMARSPDAFNLLSSYQDENDTMEISLSNNALVQRPLRFLRLPGDCLVLAIRRGEELLVPRGNTELVSGDRLTLFGPKDILDKIRDWLENSNSARPDLLGRTTPA